MSKRVLIIDTSVLCCWLKVPGKDTAGPAHDAWTFQRSETVLQEAINEGATLVLPLAVLVETGNHIAQPDSKRI